jgi:hypothetical protein
MLGCRLSREFHSRLLCAFLQDGLNPCQTYKVILIKTGLVNFTLNDDSFFVYVYLQKKVFLTKAQSMI